MSRLIIKPFLFKNELDLLEIQFEELYDVVDYFIIVEAERSFQNTVRGDFRWFEKHRDRFSKYEDKIIHYAHPADNYPSQYSDVSPRERRNFNYEIMKEIVRGLNLPSDTIVLYGDCDEIPRKELVQNIRSGDLKVDSTTIINLQMPLYYFYFNYVCTSHPWNGFKLVTLDLFLSNPIYEVIRCMHDYKQIPTVLNCGWHYSYFGDVDYVLDKINTLSHVENKTEQIMNRQNIIDSMKTGRDIYFRNDHHWKILPTENLDLPLAVQKDSHKYKKFFHE